MSECEKKKKKLITFYRKALLSKTIKMTKNWEHFFCGLCIRQWGVGIIWRKKIKQNALDSQMQRRVKRGK